MQRLDSLIIECPSKSYLIRHLSDYLTIWGRSSMPRAPRLSATDRPALASPFASPENTSYTLSSSASPASGQQLVMDGSDLGTSAGGLKTAAQGSHRDSSAASSNRSNRSLPALEDMSFVGRRERSPRRESAEDSEPSSYRAQRSRARERHTCLLYTSPSPRD